MRLELLFIFWVEVGSCLAIENVYVVAKEKQSIKQRPDSELLQMSKVLLTSD